MFTIKKMLLVNQYLLIKPAGVDRVDIEIDMKSQVGPGFDSGCRHKGLLSFITMP